MEPVQPINPLRPLLYEGPTGLMPREELGIAQTALGGREPKKDKVDMIMLKRGTEWSDTDIHWSDGRGMGALPKSYLLLIFSTLLWLCEVNMNGLGQLTQCKGINMICTL